MRTKLFALVAVVGMLGMAVGPGVAAAAASDTGNETTDDSLDVTVEEDDGVAVYVTQNGSTVDDAEVTITVDGNGSYAGEGRYTTNDDGAVILMAPSENVTIDVTATVDNETATTSSPVTTDRWDTSGAFGLQVSRFVQTLIGNNESNIGQQVADYVTSNNPGNAPDHAGPPENAGPPEHAGPGDDGNESVDENETDGERGPPAHAGGPDKGDGDDEDSAKGNGNGNGNGGGPPDHAGGPDKGSDADEEDGAGEEDDETETEAE